MSQNSSEEEEFKQFADYSSRKDHSASIHSPRRAARIVRGSVNPHGTVSFAAGDDLLDSSPWHLMSPPSPRTHRVSEVQAIQRHDDQRHGPQIGGRRLCRISRAEMGGGNRSPRQHYQGSYRYAPSRNICGLTTGGSNTTLIRPLHGSTEIFSRLTSPIVEITPFLKDPKYPLLGPRSILAGNEAALYLARQTVRRAV